MEKLPTNKKVMLITEIAQVLNVTTKTVRKYVEKLFPNLMMHGQTTWLNENQVTAIKLSMERNPHLNQSVSVPKTDLEKELIIQQALNFQNEKIASLQLRIESQSHLIEDQRPMVESFETFIESDGLSDMSQTAKLLGTGRTRLFNLLRENNILMDNNIPYQRHVEAGHFEVKKAVKNERNYSVTFTTSKGIHYIRNRFNI